MQIEGRSDDIVTLRAPDGALRRLVPLALTTVVEEGADVHHFQIVQTAPDRLGLRTHRRRPPPRRRARLPRAAHAICASRACPTCGSASSAKRRPTPAGSGKLRQVIALRGFD